MKIGGWTCLKEGGIDVLEAFLDHGTIRDTIKQHEDPAKPRKVFSMEEYSILYTKVYNMCSQRQPNNFSEPLYKRYGEAIEAYVKRAVLPALEGKTEVALLKELALRWQNHQIYVKWMERFFQYLDRFYVRLHSLPALRPKGISIFHDTVFEVVKKDTRAALLSVLNQEREGHSIDRELVKQVVAMFIDLGLDNITAVYEKEFEEYLLPDTAAYFRRQAEGWLASDSFPEYLRKAEQALQLEENRVNAYLSSTTLSKLKNEVTSALLTVPQQRLLEKDTAVKYLLDNDKRDDLARMHKLFKEVPNGFTPIAAAFRQYVETRGTAIAAEQKAIIEAHAKDKTAAENTFIQTMLDLHDRFKSVVNESFSQDSLFQKALKDAFEVFINAELGGRYSPAYLMCAFCDRLLKKTGDKLGYDDVEERLKKMVELFSFLTDKDLFAEIYRNQLSKRLLQETSASEDHEKSMIQKLKLKCGAQFTSKLEGMLNDLSIAGEFSKEFNKHVEDLGDGRGPVGNIDFTFTVLTTGYWPSYTVVELNLPPQMTKALSTFQTFYNGRTSHRRLAVVHSLGTVHIMAQFKKTHEFIVSTFQAVCILPFQGDEKYTFGSLRELTGIEEATLKKVLTTLSTLKYKVLLKDGDPKVVGTEDTFEVNVDFSCPQRRVKIPQHTAAEETHNKERVEEDRSIAIEAAIVRIMKARKTLPHQQLVAEVLSQLAFFKPSPKVIKQRIEHLIEREYLERDPNQQSTYRYLA